MSGDRSAETTPLSGEAHFHEMFWNAPLGYQSLDENGDFLDVNPAWVEVLGYERDDVLGHNFAEFLDPAVAGQFPEKFSRCKETDGIRSLVWRMIRGDGTPRDISFTGQVARDTDGRFLRTYCILTDITERKQAEQKLRDSEERFRGLVETTSDFIWEVDAESVFTYASPQVEGLFGYTPEEIVGKTPFDLMSAEEAERICGIFRDLAERGEPIVALENVNVRRDGQPVILETSGVPVLDAAGDVCGYRGIDRDITERKRAEQKLRDFNENLERLVEERTAEAVRANRAKGEFLATMSHELRTPLNSVIGFSYILLSGMAGEINEEQRRQLEMIEASGKQLLALVNDILDLSKIDARAVSIELLKTNANRVCGEALEYMRPQAEEKGIKLRFIPCAGQCPHCGLVMMDPDKLMRIVLNLLSNAVKFTKAGSVELRVDCTGEGTMFVRVTDTGVGIEEDDLERIFDEFEQAFLRDEARPQGTGLGLSISRKLANLLGGDLTVKSTPGSGSEFTLELPLRFVDGSPG
ncbi:MAG: PAS domain S-box protein [Coriobacteriia bacterium]|nr:PAS domain S-box protein [Coriobacteriia bacterium]